jgi:hypothetical protein
MRRHTCDVPCLITEKTVSWKGEAWVCHSRWSPGLPLVFRPVLLNHTPPAMSWIFVLHVICWVLPWVHGSHDLVMGPLCKLCRLRWHSHHFVRAPYNQFCSGLSSDPVLSSSGGTEPPLPFCLTAETLQPLFAAGMEDLALWLTA